MGEIVPDFEEDDWFVFFDVLGDGAYLFEVGGEVVDQ